SVSEGHNRSNVRRSTDESIADFRRVVELCRVEGGEQRPRVNCGLATAFGCTIEGDVDEDRVRRIAIEVAEAGADGIILAITAGIDLEKLAGVRALLAAALPEVTLHGAIARAGLPRNFHPVAQAA